MLNTANSFFTLDIVVNDFNEIIKDLDLMKKLRSLTLHPGSGMNHEMNYIESVAPTKKVSSKALLAYRSGELVGWAIFSEEPSNYCFMNYWYRPEDGVLFQVYIKPDHRRTGIASKLFNTARRLAEPKKLCVCPWDENSKGFYDQFNHFDCKKL